MTLSAAKQQWRTRMSAARRGMSDSVRASARASITEHLLAAVIRPGLTVCAYAPLPSEPLAPELASTLVHRGCRVLLPVTIPSSPLDWVDPWDAALPGGSQAFTHSAHGIAEPMGKRLGSEAILQADLVLVPAFAVDGGGFRLGRGGGFYDRTLALVPHGPSSGPALIAVLFDSELVSALPHGPLDRPVTHVVTPRSGVLPLPHAGADGRVAKCGGRGAQSG